jgi:hypothetical protein
MNEVVLESLLFQIEEERRARCLGQLVMLRNFEGLPVNKPGNDIDFIIRRKELPAWDSALTAAAFALRVDVKMTATDYYYRTFVFSSAGKEIIKIDLNYDFIWYGLSFMEMEHILGNTELYRTPIYVCASEADRVFVTFCHSFLYGAFINSKYLNEFSDQLRHGPEFREHLHRIFGARHAARLADIILSKDSHMTLREAKWIRFAALMKAVKLAPIKTFYGIMKSLLRGPKY